MKKLISQYSILILTLLFVVKLDAQIKSDYDKEYDFSQISTYSFDGWEKDSDKLLNDFDKKRIIDAMVHELSIRGLNYVENGGDVAITLFIVVQQKTSTTAYTTYNGGFGYRGRWGWGYGGVGMGTSDTTFDTDDYLEGTFVVDMYDATSKDLKWQGVITSVVKEKPEKREKTIPKKIKKLMKKFPVKPK